MAASSSAEIPSITHCLKKASDSSCKKCFLRKPSITRCAPTAVERTHHRVGVHLHHARIFAHGRDAPFFGIYAEKDFIANAVGYLQINGFTFLEIHRLPTIDDFRLFKPKVSQRPVEHRKHGSEHDEESAQRIIVYINSTRETA